MSLAPTMIAISAGSPRFQCRRPAYRAHHRLRASAMPQTLLRRLLAQTDVGLCQSYGMTELSGSVAFLTVEDHRLAAETGLSCCKLWAGQCPRFRSR